MIKFSFFVVAYILIFGFFLLSITKKIDIPKRSKIALSVVLTLVILVVSTPSITTYGAQFLGVGRGADLILYLLVFFVITSTVMVYINMRKIEDRISDIIQKDAIQKFHEEHGH